jgi:hypothetical protein
MKVHSSLQSSYTSIFQSQPSTDSDDTAQFLLPDDDGDSSSQQKTTAPSISSSGVPASISSFWINQSDNPDAATDDGTGSSDDMSSQQILDEFKDLANMTPAEKIRAQYLQEHNLTEDQFNQLPSDQQKAINDAIAQEIKQKLGDDSNAASDETDSAAAALTLG